MIISASRRTDIPAFFSEWFMGRVKEKYVLVRNPVNNRQISRIDLSTDVVDGIVFWTKNPAPMLDKLDLLRDYTYYFQVTLTPYGADAEPDVPSKSRVIIPAFQRLADKLGAERVIWRYDPVLLNSKYTIDYHVSSFDKLAEKLKDHTKKCTISFIDNYRHTQRNIYGLKPQQITDSHKDTLARHFSESARRYGLRLDTCAENIDLEKYNIAHGRCIDDKLFEKILGHGLNIGKDKSQRLECGCVSSIDIGAYNTCKNGCRYCYANYSLNMVSKNTEKYDPASPILCGRVSDGDKITVRPVKSDRSAQLSIFDDV